jgi:Tol biopolymer transport system component
MTNTILRSALLLALLTASSSPGLSAAGSPTRLLRTPSISATHVAFAYANNIWVVDRKGGDARRLTSFQGQSSNPKISPDGSMVAFSADYSGNTDVYVVPVSGGEPVRLTWHPGADNVQGWTPDGAKIMFASARQTSAPNATPRFWTVPAKGGIAEPLPLPRGYQGKISADGRRIAYRMNTSWDEERRNYRGGQNRPVWIVDLKSFDLVSPPWTDSKDVDPAWLGDTVYFISDRDGIANVWSYDTTTKSLIQRTRFIDYDVKSLDAGGGAVVFEQSGYLHVFDPQTGKTEQLTINAAGDFPWMMPRFEDVTARIGAISLSPTGKRVLVEARGEIFTIPEEKGDVRNITNSSGSAERAPAWSPDGKWISYFSDKSGEYKLVIESQDGVGTPREVAFQKSSFYYSPAWSPDSKKLLYTDTNLNVWVMDVATGQYEVRALAGDGRHAEAALHRLHLALEHAPVGELEQADSFRARAGHQRPERALDPGDDNRIAFAALPRRPAERARECVTEAAVRLEAAAERYVVERDAVAKLFECAAQPAPACVCVESHPVVPQEESAHRGRVEAAGAKVRVPDASLRLALYSLEQVARPVWRAAVRVQRVAPAARSIPREERLTHARKEGDVLRLRLARGT